MIETKTKPAAPPAPAHRPSQQEPAQGGSGHGHGHEEEVIPHDLPKMKTRTIAIVAALFVVLLIVLFFVGYLPHRARVAEAHRIAAEHEAKPIVDIVLPKRGGANTELVLPADARAMQETPIYPRSNGYLKKLLVDIGDKV